MWGHIQLCYHQPVQQLTSASLDEMKQTQDCSHLRIMRMDVKAHYSTVGLQNKLWMRWIFQWEATDVTHSRLFIETVWAKTYTLCQLLNFPLIKLFSFTKKICVLFIPAEASDLQISCFFKLKCPEWQQTPLHWGVCHLKYWWHLNHFNSCTWPSVHQRGLHSI